MKKRIFCMVLALVMALALAAPVFAEGEEPAPAPEYRLTEITDAYLTGAGSVNISTYHLFYDQGGHLPTSTDSVPGFTASYDDEGRLVSFACPDPYESRTSTYSYSFDEEGNLICEVKNDTTSNDKTKSSTDIYTYDTDGKLIRAESSPGMAIEYAYDDAGRLISETGATYTYDEEGYRVSVFDDTRTFLFSANMLNGSFLQLPPETGIKGFLDVNLCDNVGTVITSWRLTADTMPQLTYDENGYLIRADAGDGTYLEFTYEPVT